MHSPSLSGVSANKRAHASSPSVTSDMSVISASYDERPHKHQREQRCGARRLRLATISATTAQPCSHQPKQNHRSELASVACASSVRKARTNHAARNSRSFVKTTDQLAHLRINAPLLRVLNHFFDAQTDSTRSANFNPQLHNVNFRLTRPRTRHAHHQFTNRSSKRCDQTEVQHTPALHGATQPDFSTSAMQVNTNDWQSPRHVSEPNPIYHLPRMREALGSSNARPTQKQDARFPRF